MRVRNWMTTDVITVRPDESMMKASKLMKDNDIKQLPVVDDAGALQGIVSDRDVKEASPSKATTLDVHELYYLLSEIKVKDIMTKSPVTMRIDETVEKACVIMHDKDVTAICVLDDAEKLAGIITESDVFEVFIEITRIRDGGVQMGFKLPRIPGEVKSILEDIAAAGAKTLSVITVYPQGQEHRQAYVRIAEMEKSELNKLKEQLESKYELMFWARDNLHSLVS